jgi:hypothetical protein
VTLCIQPSAVCELSGHPSRHRGCTDEVLDLLGPADLWLVGRGKPHTEYPITPPASVRPRDVCVYFDNDAKVRAPMDAISLTRRLG